MDLDSTIDYREEVLRLITEGKIKNYTKKALEKVEDEKCEKIYNDYHHKQLDDTNKKMTETLLKQLSNLMKNLELVEDNKELEKNLNENDLLQKDLKNIIGYITPYIPYIGILSGVICVVSHIYKNKIKPEDDKKE